MRASPPVSVRLRQHQREAVLRLAEEADLTPSDVLRRLVKRGLEAERQAEEPMRAGR